MRHRRGLTLIELLMATAVFLMGTGVLVTLVHLANFVWCQTAGEESAKQVLILAVERMAPSIRAARRVDVARSTSRQLTLVLPLLDATGAAVAPLADGDVVSFYLSDRTGAPSALGTILWRSVNGLPDVRWSLRGSAGVVDLGTGGLTFTGTPAAAPQCVQLSLSTTQAAGDGVLSRTVSTAIYVRNQQYP